MCEGRQHISSYIKVIFFTTGLDVSYNNITDEGVRHLADLLQVRMYMWMIYSHLRVDLERN